MTPESVRSKLWREGADKHVYAILDGAQNENLLDRIDEAVAAEELEYECLWTGALEPDMQEVAPYLVPLAEESAFTRWLLESGWAQNWGIFVISAVDLASAWRHLRQHTRVYDPQRNRLYFRYYDPRVLNAFLPTCNSRQLTEFFGPVDFFMAETAGGKGALAHSIADGELVSEAVGARSAAPR